MNGYDLTDIILCKYLLLYTDAIDNILNCIIRLSNGMLYKRDILEWFWSQNIL